MTARSRFTKPAHVADRAWGLACGMTLRLVGDHLRGPQEVAVANVRGSALVAPAFGSIVGPTITTAPLALHSGQWIEKRRAEVAARHINDW